MLKSVRRLLALQVVKFKNRGRSPREIFDGIYARGGWGRQSAGEGVVSSGVGSEPSNSVKYEETIAEIIRREGYRSVLDIGCGDFQVSRRILDRCGPEVSYIGLDASEVIVKRNQAEHGNERVRFAVADATEDQLPSADCVLIREVLQHLSNAAVARVLANLGGHANVYVTNTVYTNARKINVDIPTGPTTRVALKSGLMLDRPPFSRTVEEVLRVPHSNGEAEIVTVKLK